MDELPDADGTTEAARIDVMAAAMVERFGEGAAALATNQLAAAHAAVNGVADHWLSIFLSIEDRLGRRRSDMPVVAAEPSSGSS